MSTHVEHREPRLTDQSLSVTRRDRTPSPRRGAIRRGSVTFDHQTSIYPEKGEGKEEQGLLKGTDEEMSEIFRTIENLDPKLERLVGLSVPTPDTTIDKVRIEHTGGFRGMLKDAKKKNDDPDKEGWKK